MMNIEQQLLYTLLASAPANSLWCADENAHALQGIRFAGIAITNRYDIFLKLQQDGINVRFNNFEFDHLPALACVIFRIAKEKAINLHIIEMAAKQLVDNNGHLHLIGGKNEGIKSLSKICSSALAAKVVVKKHKQIQHLQIQPLQCTDQPLLDLPYAQQALHTIDGLSFYSQQGVFGWNKIDKGSALLMKHVSALCHDVDKHQALLDLGCGYGYLSMMAAQLGFQHIDACDNNAAALASCRSNFSAFDIQGEVLADDCAQQLQRRYHMILCNPPFHKGFDFHKNITQQFIESIYHHLHHHGTAYVVCNQFVAAEKWAAPLFAQLTTLEQTEGFKILQLNR